ncbi:PAS domain S-box protein [Candidatus Chloroploca sp. M-50]|uniref:histidine kinase n=1 Tax=Candidatus Chloroploca mongolica TaxID=2528176 RepID=A0ABS4D6T4_9CHLR|nr:PAS domain S-box protein [Candidatus Chloroploca mongolica]MBP1465152.1 PAS domain S-box protein [Candidatus Chloroploca mongolica]
MLPSEKQLLDELRASEERFRASFEQAAVGMSHIRYDGAIMRVNQRYCDIVGYTKDELSRLTLHDIVYPDDNEVDGVLARKLLSGELRTYTIERRLYHKNGAIIWVKVTVSPIYDIDGQIIEVLGIIEDITARKAAEEALRELNATLEQRVAERTHELSVANERLQAEIIVRTQVEQVLRESEERYRRLAENAPDIVYRVDLQPQPQITYISPAIKELTGYSVEEFYASPLLVSDILFPEDRAMLTQSIADPTLLIGPFELRGQHCDGSPLWFEVQSTLLRDDNGTLVAIEGIARNITERKRTAEQLRQSRDELLIMNQELDRANRTKDEFLAHLSHELRTPLNGILGQVELLRAQLYGPLNAWQKRAIQDLEGNGRDLQTLISDLLDLTRIEAGTLELQFGLLEVYELCVACVRVVAEAARARQVQVQLELDPAMTELYGDHRRIKQMLINLLSNAVKFSHAGGVVRLELRGNAEQGRALFHIVDTGIGIAEADLPRLFQPFVQIDSGLRRHYGGIGLGLVLASRLAKLHNGDLTVTSSLGQGSRFTLSLPWQPY